MLDPLLRSSYPWTLDMLIDAIEYYVFGGVLQGVVYSSGYLNNSAICNVLLEIVKCLLVVYNGGHR